MTFKQRSSWKITRAVIFALILREMRSKFGGRRFGFFWIFFEPVAHIALIMTILHFRGRTIIEGIEFPVYLLSGMVPFFMMRGIMFKGMEAVNANMALFSYKQIKPIDTIVARAIIELVLSACIYVILLLGLGFWFDNPIAIERPLRWIGVLFIGFMLAFSVAVNFCLLIDAFPDMKTFIRLLSFPLYLLSGVIFPLFLLPQEVVSWLLWNPLVHIIDELRYSVFEHYPVHTGVNLEYPIRVTVVLLLVGLALYRQRRLKLVSR